MKLPSANFSRLGARGIVISGLLAAVLIVGKEALMFLPNVEIVSLLILCYVKFFSRRMAAFAIAVFVLLEGLLYGFGIWWVNWLYVWAVWAGIVYAMRACDKALVWAVAAGAFGLGFGALCAVPYLFMGGPGMALSYWVSGIPFDVTHGLSNFVLVFLLYQPLKKLFLLLARRAALNESQQ